MSRKIGTKERIRQYLGSRVGQVVKGSEIRDAVGNVTEWARRLRELRENEGWDIRSHIDDSTLKPGEYRLATIPPAPQDYRFAKPISARLRAEVLERNGYTCQMCGVAAGDPDPDMSGRTIRLHIGHIVDRIHGGPDNLSNLRALCSRCNQGARNTVQEPPRWVWLLSQIRRASEEDQQKALEWLRQKFQRSTS